MPSIPRYDDLTVAPRALPAARQESVASSALFQRGRSNDIAQFGKGLQQGGADLGDIAVKMQERENVDTVMRAETALRTEYMEFEAQIRERRGQDAWGVTQDTQKWWGERVVKHAEGLTNKPQRRAFNNQAEKLKLHSLENASRHESDQRRASIVESATASISSLTSLAAANATKYLEPTQDEAGNVTVQANPVSAARDDIIKRVQVIAKINGWSPQVREAEERKHLTLMHTQVINNLADSNPKLAKQYYADHKAEIDGRSYDNIDKTLKSGSLKVVVQEIADKVTAQGMTEAEAIAFVRKNYEGDEEAQGVIEVKTRFAEVSGARERAQRDAADEAEKYFAKRGRITDIPAALWNKLDGRIQTNLRKEQEYAIERAENRADRAANKAERDAARAERQANRLPATDWDKYADLRRQAKDDPEAFRRRDLRLEFGHLGRSEREALIDLQGKKPAELASVRTIDSQINATIKPLNLGATENAVAEDVIRREINTVQQARGKKLEEAEVQAVIDRMLIKGEVLSGSWLLPDPNKRLYQVTPAERRQFKADIPKAEMPQIVEALKARGVPITDDAIIDLYNATKRRGAVK